MGYDFSSECHNLSLFPSIKTDYRPFCSKSAPRDWIFQPPIGFFSSVGAPKPDATTSVSRGRIPATTPTRSSAPLGGILWLAAPSSPSQLRAKFVKPLMAGAEEAKETWRCLTWIRSTVRLSESRLVTWQLGQVVEVNGNALGQNLIGRFLQQRFDFSTCLAAPRPRRSFGRGSDFGFQSRPGRKDFLPVEPQGGLSLLCAPRSLKITTVWLTPDLHRTHGRPPVQEYRLRLKRPKSVFCNSFISSNLWKRSLEITQLYRTFLVDPGHRGLLSIELGYAKETVSLLLSKLVNPKAKTGTIEIPVTYSRIDEGTGAAKNPFLAQLENESGPGYGIKKGGARDRVLRVAPESVTDHPVKSALSRVVVVSVVTPQN